MPSCPKYGFSTDAPHFRDAYCHGCSGCDLMPRQHVLLPPVNIFDMAKGLAKQQAEIYAAKTRQEADEYWSRIRAESDKYAMDTQRQADQVTWDSIRERQAIMSKLDNDIYTRQTLLATITSQWNTIVKQYNSMLHEAEERANYYNNIAMRDYWLRFQIWADKLIHGE
jgi:hypothetical protein